MILKAEAVVLKTFDFRETSKIAVFFTRGYGKVKGLLKGIRKEPKKFGSHLNLGSVNEIVFYHKRNSDLHLISHCDLKENFPEIRKDLRRSVVLNYCLEMVDSLMAAEDKNEEVYHLLIRALEAAGKTDDSLKVIPIFQIKLLSLSGFKPHFDSCLVCEKKILNTAYFSHRLGGLLCFNCKGRDIDSRSVLKGTIATILHVEDETWARALRLGLSSSVKLELKEILRDFLQFHLEKPLKSHHYLQM